METQEIDINQPAEVKDNEGEEQEKAVALPTYLNGVEVPKNVGEASLGDLFDYQDKLFKQAALAKIRPNIL